MKRNRRNYKLEAAMLQRIVAALTYRLGGELFVSNEEVQESESRGLQMAQTTEGVSFRIPPDNQPKIITVN